MVTEAAEAPARLGPFGRRPRSGGTRQTLSTYQETDWSLIIHVPLRGDNTLTRLRNGTHKRTRAGTDEDGDVDEAPQPSLQRTARLRKNQDLLRSLRSQHGARLRLRAERGPSPQELVKQASLAARLQDLDIIRLEAGIERREPAQWDELRVWDPGDG